MRNKWHDRYDLRKRHVATTETECLNRTRKDRRDDSFRRAAGDATPSIKVAIRPLETAEMVSYLGQTLRNILRMVQHGKISLKRLGSLGCCSSWEIAELVGIDD